MITKTRAFMKVDIQGEIVEYMIKKKWFPDWPHFISQNHLHSSKCTTNKGLMWRNPKRKTVLV